MERPLITAEDPARSAMIYEQGSAIGSTVLELVAQAAESFGVAEAHRPLRSMPTQQRTFDQQANRPDSVPDISQE